MVIGVTELSKMPSTCWFVPLIAGNENIWLALLPNSWVMILSLIISSTSMLSLVILFIVAFVAWISVDVKSVLITSTTVARVAIIVDASNSSHSTSFKVVGPKTINVFCTTRSSTVLAIVAPSVVLPIKPVPWLYTCGITDIICNIFR